MNAKLKSASDTRSAVRLGKGLSVCQPPGQNATNKPAVPGFEDQWDSRSFKWVLVPCGLRPQGAQPGTAKNQHSKGLLTGTPCYCQRSLLEKGLLHTPRAVPRANGARNNLVNHIERLPHQAARHIPSPLPACWQSALAQPGLKPPQQAPPGLQNRSRWRCRDPRGLGQAERCLSLCLMELAIVTGPRSPWPFPVTPTGLPSPPACRTQGRTN